MWGDFQIRSSCCTKGITKWYVYGMKWDLMTWDFQLLIRSFQQVLEGPNFFYILSRVDQREVLVRIDAEKREWDQKFSITSHIRFHHFLHIQSSFLIQINPIWVSECVPIKIRRNSCGNRVLEFQFSHLQVQIGFKDSEHLNQNYCIQKQEHGLVNDSGKIDALNRRFDPSVHSIFTGLQFSSFTFN